MAKAKGRFLEISSWCSVGVFVAALVVWWKIALVGSFGDEQENFVASWLVQQGLVPYRDFFFHHAPLPYFLGSPLFFLNVAPWFEFRWLVLGWFALVGFLSWAMVQSRLKLLVALSWVGLAVMAPMLQLHQYLAESLLVPLVVSLFWLVVSYAQSSLPKINLLLVTAIVFSWLMIGCTVVALPIVAWFGLAIFVLMSIGKQWQDWKKISWKKLGVLVVLLWGGSVSYFWWHQALEVAWWDMITYNFQYYFPERLAANQHQVQLGYVLSVSQNFYHYALMASTTIWQATDALLHTVFTTLMASLSLPSEVLKNWLLVAATEWQHKVITLPVLSWLGWVIVAIFAPKMRGKIFVILWWLGLALVLRGRENEGFKLGVYYAVIMTGVVGVTGQVFNDWLKNKRKSLWQFGVLLLCGSWLISWFSLFVPTYLESQKLTAQIIPVKTLQAAEKLQVALDTAPAIQNQGKLYVLGGNPVYYLLVQRTPVIPEFYYHPWFHEAPEINSAVTEFLSTTTTVPVVLESELDGSSLEYAAALEKLVRERSVGHNESLYWMTQ